MTPQDISDKFVMTTGDTNIGIGAKIANNVVHVAININGSTDTYVPRFKITDSKYFPIYYAPGVLCSSSSNADANKLSGAMIYPYGEGFIYLTSKLNYQELVLFVYTVDGRKLL